MPQVLSPTILVPLLLLIKEGVLCPTVQIFGQGMAMWSDASLKAPQLRIIQMEFGSLSLVLAPLKNSGRNLQNASSASLVVTATIQTDLVTALGMLKQQVR